MSRFRKSDIYIIMLLSIITIIFIYFDKPADEVIFDLSTYYQHTNNPYLEEILTKPVKTTNKDNILDKELECLALNIYHEARGEGRIGMLLVGHVTLNRVESKLFPDSICEVVYQDSQFSWVRLIKDHKPKNREVYKKILELSNLLLNRDFDRSNGALFYLNNEKVKSLPKWVNVYKKVKDYNNHEFYTTQKL